MSRVRMAVVGVGHLGKEHARILAGFPDVDLVGVADLNTEQAQTIAQRLGTQAYTDYWPLLNLVDAVCVAVPTSFHEPVAAEFLRRGIATLVEKPLAPSVAAAHRLVELAEKNRTLLSVGHIERFNPAFEELERRNVQAKYIRSERVGLFTGRSGDTGVVLDLMIHDLDLILALVNCEVKTVEALGVSVFGRHEDMATVRLVFENGCVAEVTASRASATPARRMQVWAAEGFADVDFSSRRVSLVQASPSLRKHGLDPTKLDAASRARVKDELFTRYLQSLVIDGKAQDQLTCELRTFVNSVQTGAPLRVTGRDGWKAVALAERVLTSLRSHPWTADASGPRGPLQLPAPRQPLFLPAAEQEVA